jgi:hypothetical protein
MPRYFSSIVSRCKGAARGRAVTELLEWLNLVKIVENIGLRGGGQITELEKNQGGQPSERNEGLRAIQYTATATVFLYYLSAGSN